MRHTWGRQPHLEGDGHERWNASDPHPVVLPLSDMDGCLRRSFSPLGDQESWCVGCSDPFSRLHVRQLAALLFSGYSRKRQWSDPALSVRRLAVFEPAARAEENLRDHRRMYRDSAVLVSLAALYRSGARRLGCKVDGACMCCFCRFDSESFKPNPDVLAAPLLASKRFAVFAL